MRAFRANSVASTGANSSTPSLNSTTTMSTGSLSSNSSGAGAQNNSNSTRLSTSPTSPTGVTAEEQVVRVELKTKTHQAVKTIRVSRNAKPEEIIRQALLKNHLSPSDVAQYDLAAQTAGTSKDVVNFVIRPKDIFDSPAHGQGLDDSAYKNPLFGADDVGSIDVATFNEQIAQLMEALEIERRERAAAEDRAAALEEQMGQFEQDVKQVAEKALVGIREEFKKKKDKYKIEIEKLKTKVEVQQEQIEDLQEIINRHKEDSSPSSSKPNNSSESHAPSQDVS